MNYIFFQDKNNIDRVIRTRPPIFIGTIRDSYFQFEGFSSNIHNGKKICIDEVYSDFKSSKLNWACKKALSYFIKSFDKIDTNDINKKAFEFIKSKRKYLNISSIEESCNIKRTSLLNAVNRDQKSFGNSFKLVEFLNENFQNWE